MTPTEPDARDAARVAYVIHRFPPDHIGGTETYTVGLARRARAAGHVVQVFTHRESATTRREDFGSVSREYDGIAVRELRSSLGAAENVARAEYDNRYASAWLDDALRSWAPDLVHITHPMQFGIGSIRAAKALGVPVVVTLTDYWFLCPRFTLLRWDGSLCNGPSDPQECVRCVVDLHGLSGRWRESRAVHRRSRETMAALALADRVITLSEFQREMFARNGYDRSRFVTLPHGLEPGDVVVHPRPGRRPGSVTRFVLPGSIVAHKGVEIAIAALAAAPDLDAELVVRGPIDERDPYVQRVLAAAGADDRVQVPGPYDPSELSDVLTDADYVLAPSLAYDNAPLVPKAALALGVPVIASAIGTLGEMVTDGVDGLLVPPGAVPAWTDALRRAVRERDRWSREGRPQPTADDHARAVFAIYSELLR